jgi:hypothetical protein
MFNEIIGLTKITRLEKRQDKNKHVENKLRQGRHKQIFLVKKKGVGM